MQIHLIGSFASGVPPDSLLCLPSAAWKVDFSKKSWAFNFDSSLTAWASSSLSSRIFKNIFPAGKTQEFIRWRSNIQTISPSLLHTESGVHFMSPDIKRWQSEWFWVGHFKCNNPFWWLTTFMESLITTRKLKTLEPDTVGRTSFRVRDSAEE